MFWKQSLPFREKPFSAEVEREGSDDAELVGTYPSGSHKQHGSVVELSRSPSFVAVADDVRGKLSHIPQ